MKIAFLVGEFPKISETFIMDQITGLLDRGHDVTIFAGTNPGEKSVHGDVFKYSLLRKTVYPGEIVPPTAIRRLGMGLYLFVTNVFRHPFEILQSLNVFRYGARAMKLSILFYTAYFLKHRYDIFYAHFGPNGLKFLFLKRILNARLITVFHGYDITRYVSRYGENIYADLFAEGDLFMPISNLWRAKLMEMGCPGKKTVVHRMGINIPAIPFRGNTPAGKPYRFLSVCRLVEKKGLRYSIRAAADLIPRYPSIRYYIAGDGPLRAELEHLISDLNAERNIFILGYLSREKVKRLLYACRAFILASVTDSDGNMEGIPVALMEAMAAGLPVISTYHSGIPELIVDNRTGFLVPEGDVKALTDRMENLLENPEAFGDIAGNAREFVEKHFDSDRLNDHLVEIFRNVVERGVGREPDRFGFRIRKRYGTRTGTLSADQ